MNKSKNLTIEIPEDIFEEDEDVKSPLLRALNSSKNLHELKSNKYPMPGIFALDVRIKLMKMKNLQKQNKFLMKSCQILTNGAIQALIEKDNLVETLKEKYQNYQANGGQQALEQLKQQLKRHLKQILQLEQERNVLKRMVQDNRYKYQEELENKDKFIEFLWNQITQINEKINIAQLNQAKKETKLNIIIQQNQQMAKSIVQIKNNINKIKSSKSNITQDGIQETINQEIFSTNKKHKSLLSPTSSASTNPNLIQTHYFRSRRKTQQDPLQILQVKLNLENQKHQQQLKMLSDYYTQQLQNLKYNIQQGQKINSSKKIFQIYSFSSQKSSKSIEQFEKDNQIAQNQKNHKQEQQDRLDQNMQVQNIIDNQSISSKHSKNINFNKQDTKINYNYYLTQSLCFMVGALTGGSLITIFNRIISNR